MHLFMQATFVELPPFEKYRANYLSDDEYRLLQEQMLRKPDAGDVIKGRVGYGSCDSVTRGVAREPAADCESFTAIGSKVRSSGCSPSTIKTK
jgi:hypothetical protein